MDKDIVFTGAYRNKNWFFNKYYNAGDNGRYLTFNIVLNLLNQRHKNPTIVETGCQREVYDFGGGMSTSIFAEYIHRYGGKLITVDIEPYNLEMAKACVKAIGSDNSLLLAQVLFVEQDSVTFLEDYNGQCDLLYLDSLDYPYGELLEHYGGMDNIIESEPNLWKVEPEVLLEEFEINIANCQEHCVREFEAIEERLSKDTILLIDDNLFPGGGKPRLLRPMLLDKGWTCLVDFQQTLWVREL